MHNTSIKEYIKSQIYVILYNLLHINKYVEREEYTNKLKHLNISYRELVNTSIRLEKLLQKPIVRILCFTEVGNRHHIININYHNKSGTQHESYQPDFVIKSNAWVISENCKLKSVAIGNEVQNDYNGESNICITSKEINMGIRINVTVEVP